MKPIKLEIEGLHSFEKNQIIDFKTLGSKGVFGIFGATGSGKSTILDAIILALYGKVQRSKSNSDFINLKSKKAVVSFEFSFTVDGQEKEFCVVRTFKRKAKNNLEVEQVAEIFEIGAMGRRQLMEGATKVDNFVINLLGMTDVEFLKCIALPQGEFASFLKSKPNERVNIIGNIFDLNKYGQELWEKVRTNTEKLDNSCKVIEGKISVVGEVDQNKLELDDKHLLELKNEIITKKQMYDNLSKTEKEEREVAKLGEELEKVETELKQFDELSNSIEVKREALRKAKKLSANKFVFSRTEELNKLILDEKDEIYRKTEMLKLAKGRTDEFYCDGTIELDEIKTKTEELIAKIERLKALRSTESLVNENKKLLKSLSQDILISENKTESIIKKLNNIKVDRGVKANQLKEIEQELEVLKNQLKGYDSILIYNSLNEYVEELKRYKTYLDEKHVESVQAMTVAIDNKTDYIKKQEKIKTELKELQESVGCKANYEETKIAGALEKIYVEYGKFSKQKGMVEFLEASRLEVATEINAYNNKIEQLNVEKVRLDVKIDSLEHEILEIKSKINGFVEKKEVSLSNNGLFDIVARTKIGDNCPICRAEVLQKSVVESIDVMVIEEEILALNEVLSRKIEAKENLIYSIAKIMEKINSTSELVVELETKQFALKKKICKLLNYDTSSLPLDVDAEVKSVEEGYQENILQLQKSFKKEKLLLLKLKELDEMIVKQNCVSAAARVEVDNYGVLLNSISDSIKKKDLELLSLVSGSENIEKKALEFDKLNEILDEKLKKQEEVIQIVNSLDTQILGLEKELALSQKETLDLLDKVKNVEASIKESEILIYAEASSEGLEASILKHQAEFAALKHRESELAGLMGEQKSELVGLETALNVIESQYKVHMDEHKSLAENMLKLLNEIGVNDLEEAKLFIMSEEEISHLNEMVENFTADYNFAKKRREELLIALNGRVSSLAILNQLTVQIEVLYKELEELNKEVVKLELNVSEQKGRLQKLNLLKAEHAGEMNKYNISKELYDLLKGKALMEFVAEEFIDDISFMASNKLQVLMDGRYVLRYENKEFSIIDNFNDGNIRPVSTLSGGEMFVVSLALALSISDAIASKSNKNIDFFFLDEGFGTLDREYCEYIVDSLIKLESQNLTIGLISHIPELQERISQKVEVIKTTQGSIVKLRTDI